VGWGSGGGGTRSPQTAAGGGSHRTNTLRHTPTVTHLPRLLPWSLRLTGPRRGRGGVRHQGHPGTARVRSRGLGSRGVGSKAVPSSTSVLRPASLRHGRHAALLPNRRVWTGHAVCAVPVALGPDALPRGAVGVVGVTLRALPQDPGGGRCGLVWDRGGRCMQRCCGVSIVGYAAHWWDRHAHPGPRGTPEWRAHGEGWVGGTMETTHTRQHSHFSPGAT
jgi:hypothetical protein